MTNHLTTALVEDISPLTDTILKVILKPKKYIDYQAGQYLQLHREGSSYCYSIANAPLGSKRYELHIRHGRDNLETQALLQHIKQKGELDLSLPYGDCHLGRLALSSPILFLAGGTGFAPVKAMIEQLLANADERNFELYWIARSPSELYMDDKINYWQQHVRHFHYISLLSTMQSASLAEQVQERHAEDLTECQVVLSGPFELVYQTRDQLLAEGADPQHLFSDAFSFEKDKI